MFNKSLTILLLSALMASGGWGLWKIISNFSQTRATNTEIGRPQSTPDKPETATIGPIQNHHNSSNHNKNNNASNEAKRLSPWLTQADFYLKQHQPYQATAYIDTIYSNLSSADLTQFKQLFNNQRSNYMQNKDLERAKQLSLAAAELFDDIQFWDSASMIAARQQDWPIALNALRRATVLENRPEVLDQKRLNLVQYASQMRARYEALGDKLSIKALYQTLYNEHSNYPRFQLELAQANLKLGDKEAAKPLLKALQYEPDLGALATQKLNAIALAESEANANNSAITTETPQQTSSEIRVPLYRSGSSYLVKARIGNLAIPMLLDTGASITALSSKAINRLKLKPTGQSIQLSTANGVTTSRLYVAKKVHLGDIYIKQAVVAEINMQSNHAFLGLLGTDLLSQAGGNYGYVIDNKKNALIFKK